MQSVTKPAWNKKIAELGAASESCSDPGKHRRWRWDPTGLYLGRHNCQIWPFNLNDRCQVEGCSVMFMRGLGKWSARNWRRKALIVARVILQKTSFPNYFTKIDKNPLFYLEWFITVPHWSQSVSKLKAINYSLI